MRKPQSRPLENERLRSKVGFIANLNLTFARSIWLAFGIGAAVAVIGLLYARGHAESAANGGSTQSAAAVSVDDGKAVYEQHCLACHAADGHGIGKYPNITNKFRNPKDAYDKAFAFISRNMPQNAPGSLSDDEYKAVVKYVLSLNGIPTDFSDVDGHWAAKAILDLQDRRYIDGYVNKEQLLFKPDQAITRAEFVRYFVKTKELYLSNETEPVFADADKFKTDNVYIATAVENGLIDGFEDHTFRPDKPITRAEIAAILTRSELLTAEAAAGYGDVPSDHWAYAAIGAVSNARLFEGYEDGTFRPSRTITRAEAAAVLYRLIHPDL